MGTIQIGSQVDQWFNPDGTPTPFGYERLKFLGTLQPLSDIPAAAANVSSIDTATGAITLGYGLARTSQALRTSLTSITGALGADVSLNNTGSYFTGPSVAQGTTGTWFVTGTVTLIDTAATATVHCKLWDGTTVISSCSTRLQNTLGGNPATLSGIITSPSGDLRISCQDVSATTGKILFNQSGNSKDSHITAVRIA